MIELSAGAVVFFKDLFLLLHYPQGHWGFVKGHVERGESLRDAMIRELGEETGITDFRVIPGFRREVSYMVGSNIKRVVFFLVESFTKRVIISYEHKGFVWLPFSDAVKRLSFDNTIGVLVSAFEFLQQHSYN